MYSSNPEKATTADMVEAIETEQSALHGFEDDLHWWKQPGLRRLYMLMPFLFLGMFDLSHLPSLCLAMANM